MQSGLPGADILWTWQRTAAQQAGQVGVRVKQVWSVGRVASWDGFCLPCGQDDRPLVLTRSGASGLRAWVAGTGDDERTLLLTCRVCGQWQVVPLREEDDPEVVVDAPVVAAPVTVARPVPLPRREPAVRMVPLVLRSAPSLVSSPAPDPDAVAAARSVLAAARAAQSSGRPSATASRRGQRTAQPARRRAHRRGPTPRRPGQTVSGPARRGVVPVADATSIVLPVELLTSGHSLLLAAG